MVCARGLSRTIPERFGNGACRGARARIVRRCRCRGRRWLITTGRGRLGVVRGRRIPVRGRRARRTSWPRPWRLTIAGRTGFAAAGVLAVPMTDERTNWAPGRMSRRIVCARSLDERVCCLGGGGFAAATPIRGARKIRARARRARRTSCGRRRRGWTDGRGGFVAATGVKTGARRMSGRRRRAARSGCARGPRLPLTRVAGRVVGSDARRTTGLSLRNRASRGCRGHACRTGLAEGFGCAGGAPAGAEGARRTIAGRRRPRPSRGTG